METRHLQVPFETFDGDWVDVDAGLFDVLTRLKQMGVRTQYSCQDANGEGYIVADAKSFGPVIKSIKRHHKQKLYSPRAMDVAAHFVKQKTELLFNIMRRTGSNSSTLYFHFKLRVNKRKTLWVVERIYCTTFGRRIVLRWDKEATNEVFHMLCETSQKKHVI